MFITCRGSYDRDGSQKAEGSFLALFTTKAGGEIRALVRYTKLRQLGHFMSGSIVVKSDRAKASNDPGPSWMYPNHYVPHIKEGAYRIYLEGTYGANGLTIDVERYVGLWEVLHPLPKELEEAFWRSDGWNGPGKEGPAIHRWAADNIKNLRRLRRDE